ncbi:hypothetical protein RmaAA213_14090 [Rhodothermus marinus]|uniref:hypothetical protein n=1 Tax=Rhodothermus marinus TaxID=29549 RepID=UPI0012BA42AF|nr:hypothetical protein [Rhodothermus marinus]BBM69563.1 hypothetical protein RmaAA213_14090 [Rhodothermus marinus]BBM72545.1 hypothetical protein RmaAA338_14100 [Rhodothermus marinus]
MSFDWLSYLDLARVLAGQSNVSHLQEAANRSAVSRAYYAAFCFCRNYAEQHLGFQRSSLAAEHAQLRKHLSKRNKGKVASDLNKLRQWRNQCDYDDSVNRLHQMVRNSIRLAEQVILQIQQ